MFDLCGITWWIGEIVGIAQDSEKTSVQYQISVAVSVSADAMDARLATLPSSSESAQVELPHGPFPETHFKTA